jgi:hypothetical protein
MYELTSPSTYTGDSKYALNAQLVQGRTLMRIAVHHQWHQREKPRREYTYERYIVKPPPFHSTELTARANHPNPNRASISFCRPSSQATDLLQQTASRSRVLQSSTERALHAEQGPVGTPGLRACARRCFRTSTSPRYRLAVDARAKSRFTKRSAVSPDGTVNLYPSEQGYPRDLNELSS